jgi:hypothetical protein
MQPQYKIVNTPNPTNICVRYFGNPDDGMFVVVVVVVVVVVPLLVSVFILVILTFVVVPIFSSNSSVALKNWD